MMGGLRFALTADSQPASYPLPFRPAFSLIGLHLGNDTETDTLDFRAVRWR